MKLYYDFHIHSALSPCGDADMTPNNIVNMAMLKGLDVIAITDHNTCKNAKAVMQCGEKAGLLVIPGMEVESSEEVHMVALFPDIERAMEFDKVVSSHLPNIKNKPDIFGEQVIYDENDNIVGYEDRLLVTATDMPMTEIIRRVRDIGGAAFPSHIDKSSYSVISNLGFIPEDAEFGAVEVKDKNKLSYLNEKHRLDRYPVVHNSDAHYLWDISERDNFIEVDAKNVNSVLKALQKR